MSSQSVPVVDASPTPALSRSLWARMISSHLADLPWRLGGLLFLTYVPLAALAATQGGMFGRGGAMALLLDYAVAVRFVVAIPLLIAAESITRLRVADLCADLLESGLIRPQDFGAFTALVERYQRVREAPLARLSAVVAIVLVNVSVGGTFTGADRSWQFVGDPVTGVRTAAGWWCLVVSVPTFQFLVWMWTWRYVLWCLFLYRFARFDLVLVPTHPDHAAGLTPLGYVHRYFGTVVFAFSALLSGQIAIQLAMSQPITAFRIQLVAFVVLALAVLFVPLLVFTPKLMAVRRRGIIEYGALAARYTREFDRKWLHATRIPEEPLIGSADIQSLADLASSVEIVQSMRIVPFDWRTMVTIVVWAAVPLLPLAFFVYSPVEVLKGLAGMLL